MLIPQLYLNGTCVDAIEFYQKAFGSEVDNMMYDSQKEPQKFVIHAEMHILGSRIMLSDHGGSTGSSENSTMEIVAVFESEERLNAAYQILSDGSLTITPLGPIFYSACMVSFVDKFGVRWCFMI